MLEYLWNKLFFEQTQFTLKQLADIRLVLAAYGPPNRNDPPAVTKEEIDIFLNEQVSNKRIIIVSEDGKFLRL